MLPATVAMSCLLFLALVATPLNAFAPLCPSTSRTNAPHTPTSPTRLGMFDWINDVFGDNSQKKKEEEKAAAVAAAAKAKAEEEAREAALQKEALAKKEEAERKRAEEETAKMVARAKEEAEAKFAQFEAEQKAKAEEAEAALKQMEQEAKIAAKEEEQAAEQTAQEEAAAVAAKVVAEAEAAKEAQAKEASQEMDEDSIDDFIQEAGKNNSRIKGIVQWYNGGSGFGFIRPYKTEEEKKELIRALRRDRSKKIIEKKTTTYATGIFVHHSVIKCPDDSFFRKLYDLEQVEFGISFDKEGRPTASEVLGADGDYVKAILKQKSTRKEADQVKSN